MKSRDAKPDRPKIRKPYRAPTLHVYGNIRSITRAIGAQGDADGGVQPKNNVSL
jgi:hypothetical protein